jgi:GH43 family beta-xylosidase
MSIRLAVVALLLALPAAAQERREDFFGPILQEGADPWVVREGGQYLLCMTTGADVTLFRGPTLTGMGGAKREVVWTAADCGPGWKDVWAPELHRLDGRWYAYFSATPKGDPERRLLVIECAQEDPLCGMWRARGRLGPDAYAIDPTVATVGDARYLLWSGRDPATGDDQHLFIARLASPTKLAGAPVKLASATLPWERRGRPILEGPQVIVRGDTVNLLYAASASWTDDYCQGLLTARVGADLLDPASWSKRAEPLVASTDAVRGPGRAGRATCSPGRSASTRRARSCPSPRRRSTRRCASRRASRPGCASRPRPGASPAWRASSTRPGPRAGGRSASSTRPRAASS